MSMTLTIFVLVGLVLAITLLGFFLTDLVFSKQPGWQDLTCKMTLVGVLVVPIAFLMAVIWMPNGLISLPVLKPTLDTRNPLAANLAKDAGNNESSLSTSESKNENPIRSKAGSPAAETKPAENSNSGDGTISQNREPFQQANNKSGLKDAQESEATSGPNLVAAIPAKRSLVGWMAIIGGSIWVTGSCLLVGYFAIGWIGLRRIRRSSSQLTSTIWNEVGRRLAAKMNLAQPLLIASSCNVSTPMVAGIRKPIVLIPDSLVQQPSLATESKKKIESILGHEAMHVMRHDTTWNLLSCLAFVLWWPVPTLHLLRHRMAWVRELLCDANAVQRVGVADYAETLLQMAMSPTGRKLGVLALSMQPSAKALEARIGWILDRSASAVAMPRGLVQRSAWSLLGLLLLISMTVKLVPRDVHGEYSFPVADKVTAQEEAIHVRGKVSNDGTPAPDALVYLVTLPKKGYLPLPVTHVTAKTNEQGLFDFQDVEEGKYMLWAEGDGLTSLKKFVRGKRLAVRKDSEPEAVELSLVEGCNYRVSVFSAAGNSPIENAEVSFFRPDAERKYRTDSNGIAHIKGLTPHTWHFVIRADGFATTFNKTAAQEAGSTAELKFALGPGGTISGTLTDQHGDSVAQAKVSCLSKEYMPDPAFAEATTNMAGEFETEGIPLDYKLRVLSSPDGYKFAELDTSIEALATEVNLVIEKRPYGGDVVVTVLDEEGTPVEGAELLNRGSTSHSIRNAVTDSQGKARVANMLYNPKGDYNVVVRAKCRVPTIITVKPGTAKEPATEEVKLAKGRTLRGRIVTPEGKPAPGVAVFLRETFHFDWSGGDLRWPRLLTDTDGKFELNEMQGDTSLTFYTPKKYAPIEDYEVKLDGDVTEIKVEMSKAASLRVRAIDSETGDPIPEFNVKLGWVKEVDLLDGDVPTEAGRFASIGNPGVNVHGTTKEFALEGQKSNVVFGMTVSAEGYEAVDVTRIRATIDPELVDIELVKKD